MERLKRSQEEHDLSQVLDTPHGRRHCLHVLGLTGAMEPCPPTGEPTVDAYNTGLRDAGLTLYRMMFESNPAMAARALLEDGETKERVDG